MARLSRREKQRRAKISRGLKRYWRIVRRFAKEEKITIRKARSVYKKVVKAPKRFYRTMQVRSYYIWMPKGIEKSEDYPEGWKSEHKLIAENRTWFIAGRRKGAVAFKKLRMKLRRKLLANERKIVKPFLKKLLKRLMGYFKTDVADFIKNKVMIIEGEETEEPIGRNDIRAFEKIKKINSEVNFFVKLSDYD